jgi:curved DNA-binding protein
MEYRDYYQVMGLERGATQEEIKRTYRKLARKYHPDVSKESNAEEKFKELQEAYNVLGDPEKRAAYDQLGQRRPGEQFQPPPDWGRNFEFSSQGFEDDGQFSEFFANLFGGASPFGRGGAHGAGRPRAGRDHHARIQIPLEEAFRGGERTLQLQRPQVTPDGRVELNTHELRVKIPPGVTEGQQIRLAGQGEPSLGGGPPGDLYLDVQLQPHPRYQVDGRDVTMTLPVAPWEAALGATVQVPTLGGPVDLRVPAGARAGQKLRLRGRGLPGRQPGDQYAVLKIVQPPADTERARALYEQMKREMPFDPRAELN